MSVKISTLMRRKGGELVDHREYTDAIRDAFYIEGAIVLDCNGVKVLDEHMWDLVDQLWGYLIAGAEELRHGRDFSTYFPDQPLELTIRHVGNGGEVLISTNADNAESAVVSKDDLLAEIASKGGEYLVWLDRAVGPSSDSAMYKDLHQRAARLHPGGDQGA